MSQFSTLLTLKFLSVFFFGALIIVLYAKDKFNRPTYDSAAMGPFSQLPPDKLTMDSRYRRGRTIYIFMLLCLYTAVCIVGPKTFPDLFDIAKALPSQFQFGPQVANTEMWPVAAATFLISTGALSDSSILGRIEYFIRQYAHKTAYIPSTVRNLARYFREIDGFEWLNEPQKDEDKEERRRALVAYAGKGAADLVQARGKENIFGELRSWARACILFYVLDRKIFGETLDMVDSRLDELTNLAANQEIIQGLRVTHENLKRNVLDADGNFVPGKEDITKFLKDVSLMMAVLLSQAVRNQTELDDYVRKLGLADIHFRPSDSSSFITSVNLSVLFGAVVAAIVIFAGLYFDSRHFDLTGLLMNQNMVDISRSIDIFPWLAVFIAGAFSYFVALKVVTYFRDNAMEALEWRESDASYMRVILTSGAISGIISVISIVLFFAVIDKLDYIVRTPTQVVQLLGFQLIISLTIAAFTVRYLRESAKQPEKDGIPLFLACVRNRWPWIHAAFAALLVAIISLIASTYARNQQFYYVTAQIDNATDGLFTNQDWINAALIKLTASNPAKQTSNNDEHLGAAEISSRQIKLWLDDLQKSKLGPVHDLRPGATGQKPGTLESLNRVAAVCAGLNQIPLSAPPDPQQPPVQCTSISPSANASKPAAGQSNQAMQTATTGANSDQKPESKEATLSFDPPKPPLQYTLFRDADACLHYRRTTKDCSGEASFLGLGGTLFGTYETLRQFQYIFSAGKDYATTIVPALTAFVIAYAFGVGCLFHRTRWLWEGVDDPQGAKLAKEIFANYDVQGEQLDGLLTRPIKKLGKLTPLEALRYEEYSNKMFENIKNKQIREFDPPRTSLANGAVPLGEPARGK